MKQKKILFISYNFPPTGWSGVQRVLKFVKYLDKTCFCPVVLTVPQTSYSFREKVEDKSLLRELPKDLEIIEAKELMLSGLLREALGEIQEHSNGAIESLLEESTQNLRTYQDQVFDEFKSLADTCFFHPDTAVFWVEPAFKAVCQYLKHNAIDLVISSGPPHSSHLIAAKIKTSFSLPWIADFRDPWYSNPVLLDKKPPKFIADLEKMVIKQCDKALFVTPKVCMNYKKTYSMYSDKIELLYNGYDEEDFSELVVKRKKGFHIGYIGTIYPVFIPALKTFLKGFKAFLSTFADKGDITCTFKGWNYPEADTAIQTIINELDLAKHVFLEGYLEHKAALEFLCSSHVTLLFSGFDTSLSHVICGKVFEYARSGVPCLVFSPKDSDMLIFKDENRVTLISSDKHLDVAKGLKKYYQAYENDPCSFASDKELYQEFERSCQTKNLESFAREILSCQNAKVALERI